MLTINNIKKSFENKTVLDDLSLEIKFGEIISILGKSGSGKSTLLSLIAGFETPDSGLIAYKGQLLADEKKFVEPNDRDIGFIFQNYALFPHLNVTKNICFGINYKSKAEQASILHNMLELFDLEGHEDKYPHQLSGGQQQRVAIARAMARGSDLILFDEAFSSLDATLKLKIIIQMKKIIKEHKKTAVFVTHDPKEAIMLSDKIAFLEDGKMVQFGTPMQLHSNPASQSVSNLFGENSYIFKDIKSYLDHK